jgi:alpha-beta hydrolase superfamily lysophospholipase
MTAHVQAETITSTEFRFTSADGLSVACNRWTGHSPARGVVQIAHGMGEHIGRYVGVIEALVSGGLTVYGNDHRGHGRTASSAKDLGDFGKGGFDLLVADMRQLSRIAKDENPGKPFILMGHSMGSFAAQQYVLDQSREIDGLILSGSGALDGLAQVASSAPEGTSFLNTAFEPSRTPLDWLSRDTAVVDAFLHDPLCFPQLQPASLLSFLAAGRRLSDPTELHKIRPDLPVYLFSGGADPVGQKLEGVRVLIARYRNSGLQDISYDFYPGARHEMLNEVNRAEVESHLLCWIDGALDRLTDKTNHKATNLGGMQ